MTDKGIPEEFLKSNYFMLRPQLLQVYQEDHLNFRARIEQALGGVEDQIARDYKMLVNEINRTSCPGILSKMWRRQLGFSRRSEVSRLLGASWIRSDSSL